MKIFLKNLGPLKQAEFTLGDLTIICGKNNTGKTYATYALFGFLHAWREVLTV
ncbi:MAG: AAA family ATPase [Pseudanabaenaceae cyanobacterium]